MQYFSYDMQPYVMNAVGVPSIPVFGTVALEGPVDGVLDDIKLEILSGGAVINEGHLTAEITLGSSSED